MQSAQVDKHSRFQLGQLWHAVKDTTCRSRNTHVHNRVIDEIFKNNFEVNTKVKINFKEHQKLKIDLNDCTALHFVYYNRVYDIYTFNALLERGADFIEKNGNGQTVVHLIMTDCPNYLIEQEIPFINSVLSAHVKYQNFINPRDNNGISHLHAACVANSIEAVELFLENGASIEETVNLDAQNFAGYTPLHFAAYFDSNEVAQILINRGANVNAQTAEKKSPLDLTTEYKYYKSSNKRDEIIKLLLEKNAVSGVGLSSLQVACTMNDVTVAERLLNEGVDIDYAVPMKSYYRPGYTALHFAAYTNTKALKVLIRYGANINAPDAQDQTPLDIFINKYNLEDILDILSCNEDFRNICLSDGESKLLDLISTMGSLDQFKLFLNNQVKDITAIIPNNAILWPGYTILHVAVTFAKRLQWNRIHAVDLYDITFIEECLKCGLSINVQNFRGQSPIHLAFSQSKKYIANFLLEHLNRLDELVDLIDDNNLSYFFIACSVKNENTVERLLRIIDPNTVSRSILRPIGLLQAGSTSLHAAAVDNCHIIAEILLRNGANLHAMDAHGMTPIHWLSTHYFAHGAIVADVLFTSLLNDLKDCVVDGLALSYLHVACLFGKIDIVEKLLDFGSNINAVIRHDEYSDNHIPQTVLTCLCASLNLTPLHMAIRNFNRPNVHVLDLLIRRGANVFVKNSNKCLTFVELAIQNIHVHRCLFPILWDRDDMQQCMGKRLGLTKLHIACYMKNEENIKLALNDGTDVNFQINADSPIFPGYTPLHLLLTRINGAVNIESMTKLLLDHGADVTISNAEQNTSIHVYYKQSRSNGNGNTCANLLFSAQQNFKVNPADAEGLTHFHIACYWYQIEIIEKFLQHGSIDVNQPIDCFAELNAGCTPLHLALTHVMEPNGDWTQLLQTVDLLMKYGANVAATDVKENTPLHEPGSLRSPDMIVFKKLVSNGADFKKENIYGESPIEEFMKTVPPSNLTIFQKYGYKINGWNRFTNEGYIAKIFLRRGAKVSECSAFKQYSESTDARLIDNIGRTAIHNSVAIICNGYVSEELEDFVYAIQSFIKVGINIDYQDELGRTALHYATQLENTAGVGALLMCGTDVNIVDTNNKSAFFYATEHSKKKDNIRYFSKMNYTLLLRLHMKKLQHLNLEISQGNQNLVQGIQHFFDSPSYTNREKYLRNLSPKFFDQIEQSKIIGIGTNSLTLFYLLSETGIVTLYPLLQKLERDLVDEFFKSADLSELEELTGIIKLQFRKMMLRLELIDSAFASLRKLLGFSIPGLCEQISRFLFNSDLINLIESTK